MSSELYFLTINGEASAVLWDGVSQFPLPPGATLSQTPPAPTQGQEETREELMARVHAETDALYETLPIEVQGMFLAVYAGVKDAISRGKFRQARAAIEAQSVPQTLEQAKAAILAAIPESD